MTGHFERAFFILARFGGLLLLVFALHVRGWTTVEFAVGLGLYVGATAEMNR